MMPAPVGVVTNWTDMDRMNSVLMMDSDLANQSIDVLSQTTNALDVMRTQIEDVLYDVEAIIHNEYMCNCNTYRLFDQAITEVNSIIDNFSKATNSISDRKVNLSPTVQ